MCGHDRCEDHCGCAGCQHEGLNGAQADFLHLLAHRRYLPVARFIVKSSAEDDFENVALAPVYLRTAEEEIETVKQTGAMLLELEKAGYLTLDYDYPLDGYPYAEYTESKLYAFFCRTVEEAKGKSGFLGDTPCLELGSIAPADPSGQARR